MKLNGLFLGALLACVFTSDVIAQSSPGLTYGQVPTAGQWNGYFAAKQDALGYTPLNQAGGTMTGTLKTSPSTTSAAGFSVLPGVGPNVPNNGDIWMTSSGLYYRANNITFGPIGAGTITGPATSVVGNIATWGGTTGKSLLDSGKSLPSGAVVGTTDAQTLPNKTLPSPVITGGANFNGSISGTTVLQASSTASGTITIPAGTDTLLTVNGAASPTNKTFDTGATGNIFKINGTQISAVTGSGAAVLANSPTIGGSPVITGLPGLASNVQATGLPGMQLPCTSGSDCGIFLYGAPSSYSTGGNASQIRVQRVAPSSGGTSGNTYSTLWALCYSGANDLGYQWCGKHELHNTSLASLSPAPQNVALTGTAFKELGSASAGTMIGPTWGLYGECSDTTAVANPTAGCLGAEIDTYAVVGAGTDTNKQRVALQLNVGVSNGTDTGVHIGRGLLMTVTGGAILDNAIEINDASASKNFVVAGDGTTLVNSKNNTWSSSAYSPSLVATSSGNVANPAIGLFDANNSNGFAIGNNSGVIKFLQMPALGNGSAPTLVGQVTLSTKAWSFSGTVNSVSGYLANGTAGVTCSGTPTASFATSGGIVTHC